MYYKKIILVISFLAVFSFLFGFNAPIAKAETVEELKAIIVALQQQVAQLQKQLDELLGKPKAWCYDFNRNLKYGNAGEEVRALQTALEKEGFYKTTISGDFDEYTSSAVVGFQQKYASEILTPLGLAYGTGYVGSATRNKLNKQGYSVIGKEDSPFNDEYNKQSELLLGGKLIEVKSNTCYSREGIKGEAYVKAQWEVYDVKTKNIVLSFISEGNWRNPFFS